MINSHSKLKNIAIVAHVDHGKTTLVDGLLKQSGAFGPRYKEVERVMDSGDLEKERGITITAKNCAIYWKDTKINILDTPGHADFGGEVERSLMMVNGVLLLVDASEGPLPQTRFVLQKAMEQNLKIAVLINKVDRPDHRLGEVETEIEDLFIEIASQLEQDDFDLDIPILYASAKEGWATTDLDKKNDDLNPILDFFASDFYPEPVVAEGEGFQLLITNLSYSPYLGPLVVGRINRGSIKRLETYTCHGKDGQKKNFKANSIEVFDKLNQSETNIAQAGEIAIIAGLNNGQIGDTICEFEKPDILPRVEVEPPTVSVNVSVNTSPFSGLDGEYLTSRKLHEFLRDICRTNVALEFEEGSDAKIYTLKGRGELQLAIVFEELRRKGYEFMVSKPQVLYKRVDDEKLLEPFEMVVVDIPSIYTGTVTEKLSKRKGIMDKMITIGNDRTRIEFKIPSRGLIGYHSIFLTDTKGEGLISSQYLGYDNYAGDMLARTCGALIADRKGKATPYALFNLLSSGKQFILPGEQVYEGMVIGEHTRTNDLNLNVTREKHLSSVRTAGKDENVILPPIPIRTLDWAIDWIENDEWVEVTPGHVRIRKMNLPQCNRSVIRSR